MLQTYLKIYNAFLSLLWAVVLAFFLYNGGHLSFENLVLLNIAQGAALLEILHTALGWVKSPVFTTAIQVSSRVFILLLINILFGSEYVDVLGINGLHLAVLAWSITEIIRYAYYLMLLLKKKLSWLTFCRYTFFIFLYPIGVTGELLILWTWATQNGFGFYKWDIWFAGIVAALYVIFFPQMYKHMWKQRAKKLN